MMSKNKILNGVSVYIQIVNLCYERTNLSKAVQNARCTNLNPWGKKN